MEERLITQVVGQVMIYDTNARQWYPAGTSSGLSTVRVIQCIPTNTFRIHGQKINDMKEVVLDSQITRENKYNRSNEAFIQWHDSQATWGLNFRKGFNDAETFFSSIVQVLRILNQTAAQQQNSLPNDALNSHNLQQNQQQQMTQQQQQQPQNSILLQQQRSLQQQQQSLQQQSAQSVLGPPQNQLIGQTPVQQQIIGQVPPAQIIPQPNQAALMQQQQQHYMQQGTPAQSQQSNHGQINHYQQQQQQQQQLHQQHQPQPPQQSILHQPMKQPQQQVQQVAPPTVSAAPIPPPPPPPPAPANGNNRVNGATNFNSVPANNNNNVNNNLQQSPVSNSSNNNFSIESNNASRNGGSPNQNQTSSLASELAKCQLRKVNMSRSDSDKESECNNNNNSNSIANAKTTRAASFAYASDNLMNEMTKKLAKRKERIDQQGDGNLSNSNNGNSESGTIGAGTNGINGNKGQDGWLADLIRKEMSKEFDKMKAEIIEAIKNELRQR